MYTYASIASSQRIMIYTLQNNLIHNNNLLHTKHYTCTTCMIVLEGRRPAHHVPLRLCTTTDECECHSTKQRFLDCRWKARYHNIRWNSGASHKYGAADYHEMRGSSLHSHAPLGHVGFMPLVGAELFHLYTYTNTQYTKLETF